MPKALNTLFKISTLVLLTLVRTECVINGVPALRNEFASTVRIQRSGNNMEEALCSGVILNEILILTAGHCLENIESLNTLEVVAGDYHRFEDDNTEQRIKIAENYSHPLMDIKYDLVVLRLTTPLVFGEAVLPVSLPDKHFTAQGNMAFAGWGRNTKLEERIEYPEVLQKIVLDVIDTRTCEEEYKDLTDMDDANNEFSNALCGLSVNENASACSGDSGGGAFCLSRTERVLCGILHYNAQCYRSPPAVFTIIDDRVTAWIREVVHVTDSYLDEFRSNMDTNNNTSRVKNVHIILTIISTGIIMIVIFGLIVFGIWKYVKRNRQGPDKPNSEKECDSLMNLLSQK